MLNDPPHALLNTLRSTVPLPRGTKCLFKLQRPGTKYHTILRTNNANRAYSLPTSGEGGRGKRTSNVKLTT